MPANAMGDALLKGFPDHRGNRRMHCQLLHVLWSAIVTFAAESHACEVIVGHCMCCAVQLQQVLHVHVAIPQGLCSAFMPFVCPKFSQLDLIVRFLFGVSQDSRKHTQAACRMPCLLGGMLSLNPLQPLNPAPPLACSRSMALLRRTHCTSFRLWPIVQRHSSQTMALRLPSMLRQQLSWLQGQGR